jgi:hypothetical protein
MQPSILLLNYMTEILKISQDNVTHDSVSISLSEAYACLLSMSKVCARLLNMRVVYAYILFDSISEVNTLLLINVVSVDVYLCACILCKSL